MSNVKVGQTWKSKYSYPNIGYYTVKILKVYETTVDVKFTASEWKDKHWDTQTMQIESLLSSYDLQ